MIYPETIPEYLGQDEYWLSESGWIKISDMWPDHALRSARWLTNHAQPMISIFENTIHENIVAGEGGTLGDIFSLMSESPKTWIESTTLYQALQKAASVPRSVRNG